MKPLSAGLVACCLLAFAACTRPGDPHRAEGVNAMVVPVHDRARPGDELEEWLFRATLPVDHAPAAHHTDLASPRELIEFVGRQPREVRDNGIWVLVNDETEPGPTVRKMLRELVQLASREDLLLFICRSSEFPHGYERVN
jgi:hypothetical protein